MLERSAGKLARSVLRGRGDGDIALLPGECIRDEIMDKQFTHKRVFFASPNDLNPERLRFREIVDEINEIKARSVKLYLEPTGWEDTLPGKGRPQELINEDVTSSDLFVLLLWKRWGTPSGEYSSGTEEEFELARKLNNSQEGKPHILIYFKSIPSDMMADPGFQLRQVLDFRNRIEEEKEFFYSTFAMTEEWAKKFRGHLSHWIDDQPLLDHTPSRVEFPPEFDERIRFLELSLKKLGSSNDASAKLAHTAAELGMKAMEAARNGRFTEAQSLFASSLATYEHEETINAYVLFMDDLDRSELVDPRLRKIYKNEEPVDAAVALALANAGNFHARHGDRERAAELYQRASAAISGQQSVEFYSCFISYSARNEEFAKKLRDDLQESGIRVWFAPDNLKIGEEFRFQIDESIRIYDKLLLIISEDSVESPWVKKEVETAFDKESMEERLVLFPIRVDDAVMNSKFGWAPDIRRSRHIGDFTHWKDHAAYQESFDRLLRDLKAGDER